VNSINELADAMLRYLESAGVSSRELARQTKIPADRLATANSELSPSQLTGLWQLIQERMRPPPDFSARVRALIDRQLESGRACVAVIADQLHMSRQTLYKHLKEENQTFAALLDQVRREQALVYLRDRRRSLTEVAQNLGFSELSAFSRAFKRWMGQSPARFRASLSAH